ncbi:hypothetical protein NE857_16405 [Nocardiopsis exhalans]|uniref:Uncharacterized protein n=1 Tax=Nocardiopsis exhalans TaxID=163604 RepID=A0ABY5DFD0_9ACTN|nr:hypothetical protein [Nocardiopsis exhalans]USY23056.1 hypothetical protein NE857_16405 [Nocardiopsis exhalans]
MRFGLPAPDRHTLLDLATVGISALTGVALARTVSADSPSPPQRSWPSACSCPRPCCGDAPTP